MSKNSEVVEEVIAAYGGISAVQSRFQYGEPMAVYNWRARGLPRALVPDIHEDTGIALSRLKLGCGLAHSRTKKTN